MIVTALPKNGNSSKFLVVLPKRGEFVIALSFTLRTKIWQLADEAAELTAAKELAEALVSRHDPKLPFKKTYILAEHNMAPSLDEAIKNLRKVALL